MRPINLQSTCYCVRIVVYFSVLLLCAVCIGEADRAQRRAHSLELVLHVGEESIPNLAARAREISSELAGNLIMAELIELDKVAYVRFASVYRSFEDIKEFGEAIARLGD